MPSIIHVVMLKFNDQLPPDFIEGTLRPEAHKMVGQIPGLKRVELGKPLELTKARSQGWQASALCPNCCRALWTRRREADQASPILRSAVL